MSQRTEFSKDFSKNKQRIDELLQIDKSFDLLYRVVIIGGKKACFYFVDGFFKDEIMEKVLEFLYKIKPEEMPETAHDFLNEKLPYGEIDLVRTENDLIQRCLSGVPLLMVDGYCELLAMDFRTYPARSVDEPEKDKVMRGSRDGFVETVVYNTALVRRRIRSTDLVMEMHTVGKSSRTDVVIAYMGNRVEPEMLNNIRKRIDAIEIDSLSMNQQSLAECLYQHKWYNPFPKVRYTERPDAAAASIMEGSIVLMVDNSPSVMILPTGFFDFTQESNDYYFPPLVGTYLRVLRVTVFLLSLFITPAWYLMVSEPNRLPGWLNFLSSPEPVSLSLLSQLLVVEFLIDVLKLASLNTPDSLSNSFSMLGALVLGDFAVQAGWLGPEVLVYMAFVSVAGFAQPSYELGYAFKLLRVALLLVTAAFDVWGFCLGVVGIFILLCTTKPLVGKGYLYPLVPFNGKALLRLLVREPISRDNT